MTELTNHVEVETDGEEVITYTFQLVHAGDVCRMLISASDAASKAVKHKDASSYIAVVLKAQADMIEQGLHVQDVRAPQFMLDIEAFHQKYGLDYTGKPRVLPPDLFNFRKAFIEEELHEWVEEQPMLIEALTEDDGKPEHRRIALGLNQQLDALVDLLYVTFGAAYLQFGVKVVHEAWRRVQAANMKKVRCEREGDSKRKSTFDVIKPPGWVPPDHHDLVVDNAHRLYVHEGEMNTEHLQPKGPVAEGYGGVDPETNTFNQDA